MKIGIITMQGICNYGSVLQSLATQIIFEQSGFDVTIFNYLRDNSTISNILKKTTKKDGLLKAFAKKLILLPSLYKQRRVFDRFNNKYLNLTADKYYSEEDFEKKIPNVDIYCTGSDQVWNYTWNMGYRPELYLSFVPDDKTRISFASSIGRSNFDDSEVSEVYKELSKYKRISVREASAVEILNGVGIQKVEQVADPTLLIEKEKWEKFASLNNRIKGKYILIYQLNRNREFDIFAERIAKEKGAKLVRVCYRYDQLRLNGKHIVIPKVEDFLRLFLDADYIITDSFHATAFSLNLNKKVLAIYPNEFSSRIRDLLVATHSEYMHVDDFNAFKIKDEIYDFSYINQYLEEQRKKAKLYIDSLLDESN